MTRIGFCNFTDKQDKFFRIFQVDFV